MTTANRDLSALATVLREGDWNMRTPQELADLIADKIDALRAPAASVGDAPSDAVACLTDDEAEWLQYAIDHMLDDNEPEDARCAEVLAGLLNRVANTAPPAAPVVSADAVAEIVEGVKGLKLFRPYKQRFKDAKDGWLAGMCSDDEECTWLRYRDVMALLRLHAKRAALSVPATDDKAPAVDAEPVAWTTDTSLVMLRDPECGVGMMHARHTDYINVPLYAAPTSPHDVDAVRVDAAMVERFKASFHESSVAHVPYDEALRAALTAALRKPGDSA